MVLNLMRYNNYYNRVVKREPTLDAYAPYITYTVVNNNFNPNDNVNTEIIVGSAPALYDSAADYLIAAEDNEISSRWFIIEQVRLRNGQYRLILRRDLLADYYSDIISAPCFIEKAILPASDNMIFNPENMTYNQIKQSERLLKDETNSAWVVGYIPRDAFPEDKEIKVEVPSTSTNADITVSSLSQWEYNTYVTSDFITVPSTIGLNIVSTIHATDPGFQQDWAIETTLDNALNVENAARIGYNPQGIIITPGLNVAGTPTVPLQIAKQFASGYASSIGSAVGAEIIGNYLNTNTVTRTNDFLSLDGKTIYDQGSGFSYKIELISNPDRTFGKTAVTQGSVLGDILFANYKDSIDFEGRVFSKGSTYDSNTFFVSATSQSYRVKLTQEIASYSVTLNDVRYHANDIPYDIFCIPYHDIDIYKNGVKEFTNNPELVTMLANAIGSSVIETEDENGDPITISSGRQNIYDIQLLPYCPCRYAIDVNGNIDVKNSLVHYIKDPDDQNVSVILWATSSSFQFKISNLPYTVSSDPITLKIESETEFIRICSPNYSGVFEMTPARNGGLTEVTVNCTYKPFNPFIHIIPKFGRLYGINIGKRKDPRGLICGGDFSLPQTTSAWANYQMNNKNYQDIFLRQIENMETTQKYQRVGDIANIITGSIGAGTSAGITGTIAGGPVVGGIAGGAAGALSLAGGIVDYNINEILRNEAIDYTRDQYEYQLGNIKAIPQSLAKSSALNIINKIWPFIETYKCTTQERNALGDKIKYNGMSVYRIGRISEFLNGTEQYIKGQLIRLETIDEDFHLINSIAGELNKGVFIT